MPVVSVLVMPAGILGVLALPFGFDGLFWRLMGEGIDWMIAVALWVTSLPGAVGHMRAFGTGALLLATAGLLLLCLLRTPLRWSGAVLVAVATLWAVTDAAPRRARGRRRARGGDPRRRRAARHPVERPRHLRDQGMADGRRRRPLANR